MIAQRIALFTKLPQSRIELKGEGSRDEGVLVFADILHEVRNTRILVFRVSQMPTDFSGDLNINTFGVFQEHIRIQGWDVRLTSTWQQRLLTPPAHVDW
jgi:hypothetical protein